MTLYEFLLCFVQLGAFSCSWIAMALLRQLTGMVGLRCIVPPVLDMWIAATYCLIMAPKLMLLLALVFLSNIQLSVLKIHVQLLFALLNFSRLVLLTKGIFYSFDV